MFQSLWVILALIGVMAVLAVAIQPREEEVEAEEEDNCLKPTPPREPAPMQVIESEGPFDNIIELLNVIGNHKEFDDWGIYVDEKLLRTAIPTDSNKYLVYETIGNRIYRK